VEGLLAPLMMELVALLGNAFGIQINQTDEDEPDHLAAWPPP